MMFSARTVRFRMLLVCVMLLAGTAPVLSQSIAVPIRHEIYEFLKKMEAREIITDYHDIVKPISRLDAAKLLRVVERHANDLSSVDLRRLTFFEEEFGYELGLLDSSWAEAPRRWFPVNEKITGGVLNADLNLGYSVKRSGSDYVNHRMNGIRFFGYAFNRLGVYFSFVDNREQGNAIDRRKALTPDDGIVQAGIQRSGQLEYNYTDVQFTYDAGGVVLALEKVPQEWSLGRRGSISLSSKAPAIPQFRLHADFASWLSFTYIHAELKSEILDSVRSYHTYSSPTVDFYRPVDRSKYMAMHLFEFTPWSGIDIGLGESIVYSDRSPSLLYLLPVMFFKSGEHYNGDTDNSQFHISLDVNKIPNVNVYGSMFIDEFALANVFDPKIARNQLGYTVGFQTYDLPIQNLEWLLEYTLINPWVYYHKYPAVRFTNAGYDMGHWIGQNADDFYTELIYRPVREVRASVWFERWRKGGLADVALEYQTPSQPFLYGPVHTESSIGLSVKYQPVRDVFLDARWRSFKVSDEANPTLDHGQKSEFFVQLQYGFW